MNRQFMEEKVQIINKHKNMWPNLPNSGMEITPSE